MNFSSHHIQNPFNFIFHNRIKYFYTTSALSIKIVPCILFCLFLHWFFFQTRLCVEDVFDYLTGMTVFWTKKNYPQIFCMKIRQFDYFYCQLFWWHVNRKIIIETINPLIIWNCLSCLSLLSLPSPWMNEWMNLFMVIYFIVIYS